MLLMLAGLFVLGSLFTVPTQAQTVYVSNTGQGARKQEGLGGSNNTQQAQRFTTGSQFTNATGAPTITGPPQVNEMRTADTSGISDKGGLTGVSYSYRWIRADGSDETDISGANSST